MNFTPAPVDDFPEFIETYFLRCRDRVPEIEAIAGKWTAEDLIPGLSDFDVRFIVNRTMTASDWCRMAMEVAAVHLELALERKEWARTLEHLPGVNLTWDELLDPENYYPEFAQWSFYHGPAEKLSAFRQMVEGRPWDEKEEAYHWKKIAIYYGPYNRTIDPPINLGDYENKYPLHSRIMHYLAPPVHSLVCLKERKTRPGKIDAFRKSVELFPHAETMQYVLSLLQSHYESPLDLREPGVTELDHALERYLTSAVTEVLDQQKWLRCPLNPTVAQLKQSVKAVTAEANVSQLFELVKFARLMKGRLWFYAQDVAWFDSLPLIRIEMGRIRANFLEQPLKLYSELFLGKSLTTEETLQALEGQLLSAEQVAACRRFAELAEPGRPDAELKAAALQVAGSYEPFLDAMDVVVQAAAGAAEQALG